MRLVMDTDAIVAAMRSPRGASAALLRAARAGRVTLRTASYFVERRGRADWAAFDRLMNRSGGAPPRPGDEMPET